MAELGKKATNTPRTWVQTERKAHEAWANLIHRKPRAAMLLHHLVARMGNQNAVVVSQKLLAKLMGVTDRTVRSAVNDLVSERWVQVVKLNGPGTVNAYVINSRVAWGQNRVTMQHLSTFSAHVVADIEDQNEATLSHDELRVIPALYPGDIQSPTGEGLEPPAQPFFDDFEPPLPERDDKASGDYAERQELENKGQKRLLDDSE